MRVCPGRAQSLTVGGRRQIRSCGLFRVQRVVGAAGLTSDPAGVLGKQAPYLDRLRALRVVLRAVHTVLPLAFDELRGREREWGRAGACQGSPNCQHVVKPGHIRLEQFQQLPRLQLGQPRPHSCFHNLIGQLARH